MAANKSQALIAFILNAKVNEKDLHVAVLFGIVDLTLLLRAKRVVLISWSTVNKRSYMYVSLPKVSRKSLCYTSLPGMFNGVIFRAS